MTLVVETLADLGHLGGISVRVGGVAGEQFDGDRTAVGGVQQAEDELLLGGLAVAAMAEGGQRARVVDDNRITAPARVVMSLASPVAQEGWPRWHFRA